MRELKESLLQLITETSTNLPPDARHAIARAKEKENAGTPGCTGSDHYHRQHPDGRG